MDSKLSFQRFMYTIGAFLAPLIMAPFITLANQNISTGKHPSYMMHNAIWQKNHFDSKGSVHDVVQETPCKNSTETNPYNIIANFDDLDDDGNFYIFLGNI